MPTAFGAGPVTITADGCWADYRTSSDVTRGRPCLFLDRDGVLVEDTGYPHLPEAIVTIPEALSAVATARRAGFVAGIVSNQSGIGRGFFEWSAFGAVQAVIDDALRRLGTSLDFVLACPHHPGAAIPYLRGEHPWRKPAPGMCATARDALGLDMSRSVMLGDRASDMEAAAGAGVAHRLWLQDGSGIASSHGSSRIVSRSGLEHAIRSCVIASYAQP